MTDFDRLKMVLEYLGISANRLSKEIKLSSPQVFYDIKAGRCGISKELAKRIQEKYLNIDVAWLLTGVGEMVRNGSCVAVKDEMSDSMSALKSVMPVDAVPLVDIKSVGSLPADGESSGSWGLFGVSVPFLNSMEGDLAVCQYGDSMAPVIPAGSILHIRRVVKWRDYIGYGNDFVIILNDGRRMTRHVVKCDSDPQNCLVVHSYNPEVGDEALPKDMVSEVWKVISVVCPKGW